MRIPDHSESLYVNTETGADEVLDFVQTRLCEPAEPEEGVIVWNFSNHDIDARALLNADLDPGAYIIPFEVSGVWGFIAEVLPSEVQQSSLLAYGDDGYTVHPNYRALSIDTASIRSSLRDGMSDDDCLNPQTKAEVFGGEDNG